MGIPLKSLTVILGRAMYCGADCVKKNGIPQQWASTTKSGLILCTVLVTLKSKGWRFLGDERAIKP
jgi:hypothetical protein